MPPVPAPGIEPGLPAWEGALGATRAQPPVSIVVTVKRATVLMITFVLQLLASFAVCVTG